MSSITAADIKFIDNPSIKGREDGYTCVHVDVQAVLKSWRSSLYAFEWITPDGDIKDASALKEEDRARRKDIEDKLKAGQDIPMPILGIGVLENVEIGSGKAVLLTLAAKGLTTIPVHIRRATTEDFKPFVI